jgi:hypothetical protein
MGGHGALTIALKNPTHYRYITVECISKTPQCVMESDTSAVPIHCTGCSDSRASLHFLLGAYRRFHPSATPVTVPGAPRPSTVHRHHS